MENIMNNLPEEYQKVQRLTQNKSVASWLIHLLHPDYKTVSVDALEERIALIKGDAYTDVYLQNPDTGKLREVKIAYANFSVEDTLPAAQRFEHRMEKSPNLENVDGCPSKEQFDNPEQISYIWLFRSDDYQDGILCHRFQYETIYGDSQAVPWLLDKIIVAYLGTIDSYEKGSAIPFLNALFDRTAPKEDKIRRLTQLGFHVTEEIAEEL